MLVVASVCPAAGQIMAGPQGSAGGVFGGHRPVDPNRTSQRLSLNVDFSQGYDTNIDGTAVVDPSQRDTSGYASTAQAVVRYWRGRTNRYFEAAARSFMNYESHLGQELVGGEMLLQGSSSLGRRTQLSGSAWAIYDPALLAGQFGPGIDEGDAAFAPSHHPPQGVVQQQWFAASGRLLLERQWSPRQMTTAEYRALQREPLEGDGLQSQTQDLYLLHAWNPRPSAGVRVSYRFEDNRQSTLTMVLPPLRTSTADAGIRLQRRMSPLRTLDIEVAGGAAIAERPASGDTAGVDYVLPVASVSLRAGLTRVFSLSVMGSREIGVLEGVTPEPFATTVGTLQLEAALSRRLTMGAVGTYSSGTGMDTSSGAFDTAEARAQIQYGLGRCCGLFTSYSFYNHQLRDLRMVPIGFPDRYNRHAVRAGFTWWLPLYGSF